MTTPINPRREFLQQALALTAVSACPLSIWANEESKNNSSVIDIGSRRELLVDDFLIANLNGVELKLHKPEPRDVALVCDAPWEGNTSAYYTLFQDGERYRAYYRGWNFDVATKQPSHAEYTCYAESR